jgi:hypothetical protein
MLKCFPEKEERKEDAIIREVTNLTEDHFENYIEKSFEEIDSGHIDQVVKRDLIIGTAFKHLLLKLMIQLRYKGVLTSEEIEGISSEVSDALEWHKEKLEERYQARLMEIEAEIKDLKAQLKKIKDSEKQM